jgi:DNA-binding response OmpR family regulator
MKRKLLVVEDDLFLNKVYQEKLTREGYEVKTAEDGEAVDAILKKFTPDLIILDLVMPNKDGFAVLKELKAKSTTKNIPILVTTNLGEAENRDMCLKMGATDYFVKADTSLARLTEKIGKLLQ